MRRFFAVALTLGVVVAACGGGTETSAGTAAPTTTTVPTTTTTVPATTTILPATTTTDDDGYPVTVAAANGDVTIEERPQAIISLSPTATEMLFALGAGDQVVAVDDQSNYPEQAPITDLSGFTPNVEAIAALEPDLVVISFDPGDLVASLEALGIPVLLQPAAASLDDTYAQIEQLGVATGHVGDAAELVARMQSDIDEIVASVTPLAAPLTYYHELDPTFFTVTSATFIGQVYALLGLENIADPADTDGYGYPQLSAEYIVDQDPDLVFLADTKCCGQSPETVAQRPGWSELTAVKTGAVVPLDDDVASRWGPRVVDFLRQVAGVVATVETTG